MENPIDEMEEPEIEILALAVRQLPQQHENEARRNRADEDVWSAPTPLRARVIRDVSHQRVGERVGQPREHAEPADQRGVHAEAEVEHVGELEIVAEAHERPGESESRVSGGALGVVALDRPPDRWRSPFRTWLAAALPQAAGAAPARERTAANRCPPVLKRPEFL